MADPNGNQQNEEKRGSRTDLLLWFALLPFVLGSLFCVGELATLFLLPNPSVNTKSLISANYFPWPAVEMPEVDMTAVFKDMLKDMSTETAPTFEVGILLDLPTASSNQPGKTPEKGTPSPTAPLSTPAGQLTPTATQTSLVATRTPSPTPLPTITRTSTRQPPPPQPPPTATEAPPEPEPPTNTPVTPTRAAPSPTFTSSPTATWTVTPSITPTLTATATPTLDHIALIPFAEGNGPNGTGGCRAYFGYLNSNPQPVTIPPGPENILTNSSGGTFLGTPPTTFKISRVFSAFYVDWTGGGNIVWMLDGNTATAYWCNPPVVP